MNEKDFSITLLVDQSPKEVFDAVTDVRGWWSHKLEGKSRQVNDEFVFRYEDKHWTRHKLTEVVPNKKVVWLVTDGELSFLQNKGEWIGTSISFDIEPKGNKTELHFTHHGLVPEVECYDACMKGWTFFINKSLHPLITTGKGKPYLIEE